MTLRLRTKLLLGVVVYLLLVASVGMTGLYLANASLEDMYAAVDHHVYEVNVVADITSEVHLIKADLLLHVLSSSREEGLLYEREIQARQARVDALIDDLLVTQQRLQDVADLASIRAFRESWIEFVELQDTQFLPVSRDERDAEAYELARSEGRLGQSFNQVQARLEALRTALPGESADQLQRAIASFVWNRNLLLATLAIAGALSAAVGLTQVRRVAQAIEALAQGARGVAGGNLAERVHIRTGDELQWLADSFNSMTESLAEMTARQAEQHRAVERMKNEFVSMVSHELRTPLNGIIGMTDLLLRHKLDAPEREYALAVQRSGEVLLAIINDILDLSKIEAGRLELQVEDLHVREVVEDVVALLAEQAQSKGLEIACFVEPAVPDVLIGDANRLRQILLNLIGNAIKFTDAGEVVVRAEVKQRTASSMVVRFDVVDTGPGISEQVRSGLFQSFSQADPSSTRRHGGTGLGLAISKRLADLMGGDIGIESSPRGGSDFWVTMQFGLGSEAVGMPESHDALAGRRVLIVDDNASSRSILARHVATWRMLAIAVGDASAALDELARGPAFDVLLVDKHMPGTDGLSLVRQIVAEPSITTAQCILLTSLGSPLPQDASNYARLEKPVRRDVLRNKLLEVLHPSVAAAEIDAEPQERVPLASSARILLVEDTLISRQAAAAMLRGLGYDVDVATNGREALQALEQRTNETDYAAIIMDCYMPELDGFEATAEIRRREDTRRLPVIPMTASAMQGDRERCLAAGMDDFLAKPVRFEGLESVMHRWAPIGAHPPVLSRVAHRRDRGASSGALDDEVLAELRMILDRFSPDDPDALAAMISQFRGNANERLLELREAARTNNPVRLQEVAHGLRGTAATLGARQVQDLASRIERSARDGSMPGAEALLQQLDQALDRAVAALDARIQQQQQQQQQQQRPAPHARSDR
jgi:signal transduction histidine kinase/DNA-binding response OmpR family regulator/HPt (histidine-containing phosphotransfer) domain-containing protein